MLVFDLEFYVPTDQQSHDGMFRANPWLDGHVLLGGVFCEAAPSKLPEHGDLKHIWLWNRDHSEKRVLEDILALIDRCWEERNNEETPMTRARFNYPVLCGLGIARIDLPYLFARCTVNNIRSPEELFRIIHTAQVVDLSQFGGGVLRQKVVLYPSSANFLMQRLGISDERKPPGTEVWSMYEEERFSDIEKRTEGEVVQNLAIYRRLIERQNKNR